MEVPKPTSFRVTSKDHSFTRSENSISDTTWWSLASTEKSKDTFIGTGTFEQLRRNTVWKLIVVKFISQMTLSKRTYQITGSMKRETKSHMRNSVTTCQNIRNTKDLILAVKSILKWRYFCFLLSENSHRCYEGMFRRHRSLKACQ